MESATCPVTIDWTPEEVDVAENWNRISTCEGLNLPKVCMYPVWSILSLDQKLELTDMDHEMIWCSFWVAQKSESDIKRWHQTDTGPK